MLIVRSVEANNDIDAGDFHTFGGIGQARYDDIIMMHIPQLAGLLDVEMVMIVHVGVEVRPAGLNHHFTQQPGIIELVQRIVNRCEGNPHFRTHGFTMKLFGGEMAIFPFKQELGQGQSLPRRAQTS